MFYRENEKAARKGGRGNFWQPSVLRMLMPSGSSAERLQRLYRHMLDRVSSDKIASDPRMSARKHPTASPYGPGATLTSSALLPVPILSTATRGHVHPSICKASDGTLVVVYGDGPAERKNALMCTRSVDGSSWTRPETIEASQRVPANFGHAGSAEVYPGTLTTLPDSRLLLTWCYSPVDSDVVGACCYCISSTNGKTWGDQQVVKHPTRGHLGVTRHGVSVWPDGRWLLTQRDTLSASTWLFDQSTATLEPFESLCTGGLGSHKALIYPVKQIVVLGRSAGLRLLAMGAGGPHRGEPPCKRPPEPAVTLFSEDGGNRWETVPDFPANAHCPEGVAAEDWDDDGDREGRHLCPLQDGRVLATWCIAGKAPDYRFGYRGIRYNISEDGRRWDASRTVTVLADLLVVGRYVRPTCQSEQCL